MILYSLQNPVGTKMASKIDQVAPKYLNFHPGRSHFVVLKPSVAHDTPATPRGLIFDDFGTLPGPILNDFQ